MPTFNGFPLSGTALSFPAMATGGFAVDWSLVAMVVYRSTGLSIARCFSLRHFHFGG
jgi:hypothetical protein